MATGRHDITASTAGLQALRWLRRVSRHLSRSLEHLHRARLAASSLDGEG